MSVKMASTMDDVFHHPNPTSPVRKFTKCLPKIQDIFVLNLVTWFVFLKKKQSDSQSGGDLQILWHFIELSMLRPK